MLSNERVTMDHILESHQTATAERCARERVVLAIQDTTSLNYDGFGPLKAGLPSAGAAPALKVCWRMSVWR